WNEPFFDQTAAGMVDELLQEENTWRDAAVNNRLRSGEPVLLKVPGNARQGWGTPSGRIEIRNDRETEPLPRLLPTHAEADGFPLRLQAAPNRYALNSSFYEQEGLRARQGCMQLMMHPVDAQARGLGDAQAVLAVNDFGQVRFNLKITERTPPGTVVAEGVWWREFVPGEFGINALMSQRLTDSGRGSTLYDVTVEVRAV
ncbi:MAG: molybdopterin dinucleotide binding domain-containing protein, partial [Desulfobulbus sp.]